MPASFTPLPERALTTARAGAAISGITRAGWTPSSLQVSLPVDGGQPTAPDAIPRYYKWKEDRFSTVTWTREGE